MDSDGLLISEAPPVGWGGKGGTEILNPQIEGKFRILQILWINALWVVSRRDRTFLTLY